MSSGELTGDIGGGDRWWHVFTKSHNCHETVIEELEGQRRPLEQELKEPDGLSMDGQ